MAYLIGEKSEESGEACLSVAEAKKLEKKWIELNKLDPNAYNTAQLACIWYTIGKETQALQTIEHIVDLLKEVEVAPALKSMIIQNRGMFRRGFGNMDGAKEDIDAAFELNKSSYCNLAKAEELLRVGEWEEGWKIHNTTRGTCRGAALAYGLKIQEVKFWDGKETPSLLLVLNEGGSGDRINYTRFLPELTKRGINWKFHPCELDGPQLQPFYERLPWIGEERLVKDKEEFSPPPSHWTTTFALSAALGITQDTIPQFPTPFTAPESNFRLTRIDTKPVVGLSFSANELFQGGLKIRSLSEGQAMRLICQTADKVNWVNLQHGHKMPFPVLNVDFDTWQDTSIVIDLCDAVVCPDNGTRWLASAMGKPTAVLLTSNADWKYFKAGKLIEQDIWDSCATLYHNGPSQNAQDPELAINKLVADIRSGKWPSKTV